VSTFGVIVGNRGFFPDVLARDGREEILRVLGEQGHKAYCLTPEESKFGSVETFADARRCADLFRSHGDEIDGVIVSLPNFGDERAIADTLRLAEARHAGQSRGAANPPRSAPQPNAHSPTVILKLVRSQAGPGISEHKTSVTGTTTPGRHPPSAITLLQPRREPVPQSQIITPLQPTSYTRTSLFPQAPSQHCRSILLTTTPMAIS